MRDDEETLTDYLDGRMAPAENTKRVFQCGAAMASALDRTKPSMRNAAHPVTDLSCRRYGAGCAYQKVHLASDH